MGDLRNKINKLERAAAEKANGDAWLRRRGIDPDPKQIPARYVALVCRGCLHNHMEVQIYSVQVGGHWGHVEHWCWNCMPADLKEGK